MGYIGSLHPSLQVWGPESWEKARVSLPPREQLDTLACLSVPLLMSCHDRGHPEQSHLRAIQDFRPETSHPRLQLMTAAGVGYNVRLFPSPSLGCQVIYLVLLFSIGIPNIGLAAILFGI